MNSDGGFSQKHAHRKIKKMCAHTCLNLSCSQLLRSGRAIVSDNTQAHASVSTGRGGNTRLGRVARLHGGYCDKVARQQTHDILFAERAPVWPRSYLNAVVMNVLTDDDCFAPGFHCWSRNMLNVAALHDRPQ